jgi:nicotinate phosphoribosyltransferase
VSSFEQEIDAFRAYVASFPKNAILLIDTYDTMEGARHAAEVGREMAERGEKLIGVRIDSGDLAAQAREVRKIFDDAALPEVKIIGSGGLDEVDLLAMSASNTPYDSYGVGTKMGTSADAPWADMCYKLVEYGDQPMLKLSPGKLSCPGKKQVFRQRDGEGNFQRDLLGLRDEGIGGEKLLKEVMRDGKILGPQPSLTESRATFAADFASLPREVKAIHNPRRYDVDFTAKLMNLRDQTAARVVRSGVEEKKPS